MSTSGLIENLDQTLDIFSDVVRNPIFPAGEVEKYKGRVETLLLLKSTFEACYTEQRDRLHAPLRRHLKPFLNDVFPAAEIELGDGFSIAGIRRNGPNAENFERLSAGTQEQIAVLVRLAMGAMICDRGQPVPIILDDALVFARREIIKLQEEISA